MNSDEDQSNSNLIHLSLAKFTCPYFIYNKAQIKKNLKKNKGKQEDHPGHKAFGLCFLNTISSIISGFIMQFLILSVDSKSNF